MVAINAPFPYFFGGKSSVASIVWERFGNIRNYVEPFFGSGAVLLSRPAFEGTETVNDLDGMIANFWRSVALHPDETAEWADWPVNENDLHARHLWLVQRKDSLGPRLEADPDWCDPQIAGWWVWGISQWIGSGWCSGKGPWRVVDGRLVKAGDGVGVARQLPLLGCAGSGVHRKLPHLGDTGKGVHRQLPHLGCAGKGVCKDQDIYQWFAALSNRLRRVRVACGDWSRVCGPSVTIHNGLTGVFLDPPYTAEAGRDMALYATDSGTVGHDVAAWCRANEANPLLRIALCGYEGEYEMPGWECVPWKAKGGYGSQGETTGRANAHRERIWFSPGCQREEQGRLW